MCKCKTCGKSLYTHFEIDFQTCNACLDKQVERANAARERDEFNEEWQSLVINPLQVKGDKCSR